MTFWTQISRDLCAVISFFKLYQANLETLLAHSSSRSGSILITSRSYHSRTISRNFTNQQRLSSIASWFLRKSSFMLSISLRKTTRAISTKFSTVLEQAAPPPIRLFRENTWKAAFLMNLRSDICCLMREISPTMQRRWMSCFQLSTTRLPSWPIFSNTRTLSYCSSLIAPLREVSAARTWRR